MDNFQEQISKHSMKLDKLKTETQTVKEKIASFKDIVLELLSSPSGRKLKNSKK